ANGIAAVGVRHYALILLKSCTAVHAVPAEQTIERIQESVVAAVTAHVSAQLTVVKESIESAQCGGIDQGKRRIKRHRQTAPLLPFQIAVRGVVTGNIMAAPETSAAG